ncbi:MAG: hypothetical protein Q4E53_12095 [Eubacteriales bacterium]|nr:hypothetical protein [Eubacteriales bacterium]
MKDPHRYDDMLYMPHHRSKTHPQMSNYNRAAQFSPFAALTGYGDAISEEARYTDRAIDLDENQKTKLDRKIQLIQNHLQEKPEVILSCFIPDALKAGGSYKDISGIIKKIDSNEHLITFYAADGFHDGIRIKISQILDIDSVLFHELDNF